MFILKNVGSEEILSVGSKIINRCSVLFNVTIRICEKSDIQLKF